MVNRRLFLSGMTASSALVLSGCAGISKQELNSLGSTLVPKDVDFDELHAYALRAKAAYGTEAAIRASYPKTVRVAQPGNSEVLYFLERDDAARTQRIAVRGTANRKNLSEDTDFRVRDDRQIAIPVHEGFDKDAQAIHGDVGPYLKKGYRTYVTGHSLGGAVAAILAIYLIEDKQGVERVITFGQPRFTTAKGVDKLQSLPLTRVVDENDVIPLLPPATTLDKAHGPYEHVGPEIILLEGPRYVYLPGHDANRIAIGEFWRSAGVADLKDHKIDKYIARIAAKRAGAQQVAYNEREKYVAKKPSGSPAN